MNTFCILEVISVCCQQSQWKPYVYELRYEKINFIKNQTKIPAFQGVFPYNIVISSKPIRGVLISNCNKFYRLFRHLFSSGLHHLCYFYDGLRAAFGN